MRTRIEERHRPFPFADQAENRINLTRFRYRMAVNVVTLTVTRIPRLEYREKSERVFTGMANYTGKFDGRSIDRKSNNGEIGLGE